MNNKTAIKKSKIKYGHTFVIDKNGRRRPVVNFDPEENLTHQSFKDSCDITNIVNRYRKTGMVHISTKQPMYGDQPEMDFQETQMALASARTMFEELPENARQGFTDVSDFIEALSDPSRHSEIEGLGETQENPLSGNTETLSEESAETFTPADPLSENEQTALNSNRAEKS